MAETDDAEKQFAEITRYLVEPLLGTDDFTIETGVRRAEIRIALKCPEDLRGRVIGRGGRIARAIRTVLDTADVPTPLRPTFDIVD